MILEKESIDAIGMLAKMFLPKSSKSTDHHVGTSLGVTGDASLLKVHDGENVVVAEEICKNLSDISGHAHLTFYDSPIYTTDLIFMTHLKLFPDSRHF